MRKLIPIVLTIIGIALFIGCREHRGRRYIVLPTSQTIEKTQIETTTTTSAVDSITINIDWEELRKQLVCQTECDQECCDWDRDCREHNKKYCDKCWRNVRCKKNDHDD